MFSRLRVLRSMALLFCLIPLNLLGYEIIFTQISTSDGLSSNFVNCIAQSSDGYMWVGTRNGLQRYDGYQFTQIYRNKTSAQLPALPVDQILPSNNPKQLWLKMGQTVGLFNTSNYTFKKVDISKLIKRPEKYIFELFKDSRGNVFLLMNEQDIFVYNTKKEVFEKDQTVIKYSENWRPLSIREDKHG